MAAVFSGWVFLVTRKDAAAQAEVLPRFMALAQQTLVMYHRDPKSFPSEEPTFTGVVTKGTAVETQGRKVLPNGMVLHLFSFSSGTAAAQQNERKVEIGCSSAEGAHQWASAIQAAAYMSGQDVPVAASTASPHRDEHGHRLGKLAKFIPIGAGSAQVHPATSAKVLPGHDDEEEDDAADPVTWRLIRLVNGLRIFEGHASAHEEQGAGSPLRLLKAEGIVEAEPDRIFEIIMNLNAESRSQWDMVTADAKVEEVINGFTDVIRATYRVPAKGGKSVLKDFVSKRSWTRNEDGSYVISFFPDEASTRAIASDKTQRLESAVYTWDIVPLCGAARAGPQSLSGLASSSAYAYPRSLLRHVLEVQRAHTGGHGFGKFKSPKFPFFRAVSEKEKDKDKDKDREKEKDKERDRAASTSALSLPGPAPGPAPESLADPGALEEFAEGVPLLSLSRIAGLREYFAALPPPSESLAHARDGVSFSSAADPGTMSFITSLSSRQGTGVAVGGDEFFDAIEMSAMAEVDQQKHEAARKRWQRIKWLLKFGLLIQSMSGTGEVTGLSWNVPRELLHNCPPVDLAALGAKLTALGSVPLAANADNIQSVQNGYRDPGGASFSVRGPNYLLDHVKVPAGEPLLKLVAMDWFTGPARIDDVAGRPGSLVQSEAGKALPFIFVVNLQVPGPPHYSLAAYFASDRPIRAHPKSLLHRFYTSADHEFRNRRLKLIPRISEGHWMVKRAVGTKACILGKALQCSYAKGRNYLEMDCDIGSSSVARNVIGLVISYVTSLVVDLVFLIEAQEAEELPEYLLGAFTCIRLDTKKAVAPPPEAPAAQKEPAGPAPA